MSLIDRFNTNTQSKTNTENNSENTEKKELLPQDKLRELIQHRQNLKKNAQNTQENERKTPNPLQTLRQNSNKEKNSFISRYSFNLGIIDTILADDEINSIFVNGAKNIYIEKKGRTIKSNSSFTSEFELQNLVEGLLKHRGFNFEDEKFFTFNYKKGINLTITLPPLSQKITIILKNYNNKYSSIKTLQENQVLSKEIALFLESLMLQNVNILITGEEKSLKTTVLDSLIKTTPENLRNIIIDYSNEIETDKNSCAFYDFTNIDNSKDSKNEEKLITALIKTNPDKIFINDLKRETKEKIFNIASPKKGFITVLDEEFFKALEHFEAQDSLERINSSFEDFKLPFDIIIKTKNIKEENKTTAKISSISQIYQNEIQEIFKLNEENKLVSCGIIPKIYFEIKSNSLSINQNIFESTYRHTYSQNYSENLAIFKSETENNQQQEKTQQTASKPPEEQQEKKGLNLEVLKKFKPNTENNQDNL